MTDLSCTWPEYFEICFRHFRILGGLETHVQGVLVHGMAKIIGVEIDDAFLVGKSARTGPGVLLDKAEFDPT